MIDNIIANNNTKSPEKKSIVLYEPSEEVTTMYRDYFLDRFNADGIRGIMKTGFHFILTNYDVTVEGNIENSHSNQQVKNYKETNGGVTKNIMAAILGIFVSDIRNMTHYMEILSPETIKLMQLVACNHVVSHSTIEKETGRNWLIKSSVSYGSRYKKNPELVWIECAEGRNEKTSKESPWEVEYYFYMDAKFRPLFMPFFISLDKLRTNVLDQLPALSAEPLKIFSAEKQIFSEIPVINGLYKQGRFVTTESMRLTLTTVKKLGAQMKMLEFYPEGSKLLLHLRASMILQFYNTHMKDKEEINDHPEKIIKDVFQRLVLTDQALLLSLVLPHITGFKDLSTHNTFNHKDVLEFCGFLFDYVRANNKGWIDFEQLLNSIMLAGVPMTLFEHRQLGEMPLQNKLNDYPVYLDKTFEEVTVSFFKGFLYLMAAFGIVEIAHTDYNESDASPFSCLRYFRLTDFGLYTFEFKESYKLPEVENKESLFSLDDKNLIVHSLTDDNPYDSLLADMSEPIGNKRYKITFPSMLKSCNTQKDVIHKIDFFKRFISNDLPEIWEDFFKSLVERSQPMKEIKSSEYAIYQLDPTNEELLQLLLTDPQFRKYTYRAENYLLLVDADKQKEMIARLKSFGYLLEIARKYYYPF